MLLATDQKPKKRKKIDITLTLRQCDDFYDFGAFTCGR